MAEIDLTAFYRAYATRCGAMSREVPDAASKFTLLGMAQAWLALADQAETSRATRSRFDLGYLRFANAKE